VLGFPRVAAEDVDFHGHRIRKGELVFLLYASANRDPARFPDPNRLDLRRQDVQQLAFGHGPHTCIGAPLARLFAEVALTALVQRLPAPRLATEQLGYREHFILHGVEALPITWGPE
jgi:cytochrome P450